MKAFAILMLIGSCALLAAGCATNEANADATYVVQPHDTLYSIAWRHDLDYRDLARWNGLAADFRIAVGQTLRLMPGDDIHAAAPAERAPQGAPRAQPAQNPAPTVVWVWPTVPDTTAVAARSGLLFAGRLGQPVRAAAAGRVVYTGSGIRGYGQLIIIKHTDTLLSAYAYNRSVSVQEGADVGVGQVIAEMGAGPQQRAELYFEIRLNGRPVNPLNFIHVKK